MADLFRCWGWNLLGYSWVNVVFCLG